MFPRAKKGIDQRARSEPVSIRHQEVSSRGPQGNQEGGYVRVRQIDMARYNRGIFKGRNSYRVQPSCRVAEVKLTYLANVTIRERARRGGSSLNQGSLTADNLPVRDGCDFGLHGCEVRYQRGDSHAVVIRAVQRCRGAYTLGVLDVESEPHMLKGHGVFLSASYGVPGKLSDLHLRVSVSASTSLV